MFTILKFYEAIDVGMIKKISIICLWIIVLPVLIIMANNRYFYFINNLNDLILWIVLIISFFMVFSITVLYGFRNITNNKILNIEYEENPAKKLFELAQKYHLDLEINDALKIYDEIKKKYPNSIYEKEAQIEINRIKGNRIDQNKTDKKDKALELLRIGYAKGDISKEEFEERKNKLEEK